MKSADSSRGDELPIRCLPSLLEAQAAVGAEREAIAAPGLESLRYRDLHNQVWSTVRALRTSGIGPSDRVAVVLENGPEMAVAFLSVASGASCAPLNPNYRAKEFEFFLSDLQPKALLIQAGVDSPSRRVAENSGLRVIELVPDSAAAGKFSLRGLESGPHGGPVAFAGPQEEALVLHTSGTTSRPKIVPLTHANLWHSAQNIGSTLRLTPDDRCLNVMPLFHIHGLVGAVLSSIAAGSAVVCTPGFYASDFLECVGDCRPTWYTAVPTMHQTILERVAADREAASQAPLRLIRSSSAALAPQLLQRLEETFHVPVIESYGMTEAAHQIASNPLPPGERKPGSVGPGAGPEIEIMDDRGRIVPRGEIGEVVIRGPTVTPGYENNPQANKGGFAGGWFRTGDQGRLDGDGYLFITGRLKEIINRAGEKISPREVDEALLAHTAVAEAVTFAMPHSQLGEEVAAAVVIREDSTLKEVDLREYVATRLADFKVPRKIVFLDQIPKGPTGKLQRIGLATKLGLDREEEPKPYIEGFTAPRNQTEAYIADLWVDVLKVARVGVRDSFVDLGGDSMLAARFLARLRAGKGVELSMTRFFDRPTVAAVADWLNSARREQAQTDLAPIQPVKREESMPLSFGQRWIWYFHHYRDDTAYNRPHAYRLKGPLNAAVLEQALTTIVARHESLRTLFSESDGIPSARIQPPRPVAVNDVDLTDPPSDERLGKARKLALEEAGRPFDLSRDLPIRAVLYRIGDDDHVLMVTIHHIASDGWSTGVFLTELNALYIALSQGAEARLPELTVQYADFVAWQYRRLQGEFLNREVDHWKNRLAGCPELLTFPTDRPRPREQTFHGAAEIRELPGDLTSALKALSRREGVTLFMTLLAGFQTLLGRYARADDVVVGSPAGNRTHMETERLIGFFANIVPLRTDLSGNPTFTELLFRVRETCLSAYVHQEIPFDKLVGAVKPKRARGYSPIFQVLFQLRNYPTPDGNFGDLEFSPIELGGRVALLDLTMDIVDTSRGLRCRLAYNRDLFDAVTIRRTLANYEVLLQAVIDDPNRKITTLPLLTRSERRTLLKDWNRTASDFPKSSLAHELFAHQAAVNPTATALRQAEHELTYGDVNALVNRWAHLLQRHGVGPEKVVAVCMERSPDTVIAMLAVLKAGGAFVNVDPGLPTERIAYMLVDADVEVVICRPGFFDELDTEAAPWDVLPFEMAAVEGLPTVAPANEANAQNLAYVVYTSGTTGEPKGVAVEHRSVLNHIVFSHRKYGVTSSDRRYQFGSIGTDFFISEVLNYMSAGATLIFRPDQTPTSINEFLQFIDENEITITGMPSSFWNEWVTALREGDGMIPPSLRVVITGMEQVRPGAFQIWKERVAHKVRWFNAYGPSETTMVSTVYEANFDTDEARVAVPIGRPIANTKILVLDEHRNVTPVGVPGELYIGGEGVARGYLNRPTLTKERFVTDPLGEEATNRFYRTGDLVRYLPDGNLVFLGRIDRQVKIRGFRVELDEIEAVLDRHETVRQCAVGLHEDILVGYVVSNAGAPKSEELRRYLRRYLPEYMVPSQIVVLEEMPLTRSGKIDRRALPVPTRQSPRAERAPQRSLSDTERALAETWSELLGMEAIQPWDDFFDLGGDSLKAVRLIASVGKVFGIELPTRAIFDNPCLADLGIEIDRRVRGDPAESHQPAE